MKNRFVLLLVVVLLLTSFIFLRPATVVHAACAISTGYFSLTVMAQAGSSVTITVSALPANNVVTILGVKGAAQISNTPGNPAVWTGTSTGGAVFLTDAQYNPGATGVMVSIEVCGPDVPAGGSAGPAFNDGRLNNNDAAQTAAIYCEGDGITVYGVKNSVGTWAFHVSRAEINAVPANPTVNTVIKAAMGIRLYRLMGGKFAVIAPVLDAVKTYDFVFDGCPANS